MSTRTTLAIAFVLSLTAPAHAQVDDALASTSFEYYPSADDDSRPGETVQLNVFRAHAGVPIAVGETTTLITGAGYELIDVHPSGERSFQLHAPSVSFGVIQQLGDRWAVWAMGDLGFASDFSDSVGSDDLLASVTGLVSYELSDSFTLGAGATYDRRSGKLAPLPAILLNVRMGERARIRGFVPAHLTAEYRVSEWLDVGVRGTFEGNRFHVGKRTFGEENLELSYSTMTAGPKVTLSPSDWLHFDLYAAGAVRRRYEFFQNDDSVAEHGLGNTVAYGVQFRFGPSQWGEANEEGREDR